MASKSFQYRINRYTCEDCKAYIITVDRDLGVTPFLTTCKMEDCNGLMQSAVYRCFQEVPEYEWYRPSLKEYKRLDIATKEHIQMGGLLLRKISDIEDVTKRIERIISIYK